MTNMAAMPIYGNNLKKTWYVALFVQVLPKLFQIMTLG